MKDTLWERGGDGGVNISVGMVGVQLHLGMHGWYIFAVSKANKPPPCSPVSFQVLSTVCHDVNAQFLLSLCFSAFCES